MGESRRDRPTPAASVSAVEPEWVVASTDPEVGEVSHGVRPVSRARVVAGVVLVLALAAALVAATGSVDLDPVAAPGQEPDPIPRAATTILPAPTTSVGPTPSSEPAPPDLGPAPAEWLDGQVLAFIDDQLELQLFDLATGRSVVGNQWATFQWPPLPDSALLLGAPNRSFAIDPGRLEDSGRISTTVHTVRLSEGNDRFGFFSETPEGFEFFVGSQWGPAQNGLDIAPLRAQVFAVPGRAIVVSEPNGSSRVLTVDGFEDLPSRLGRVVAVTGNHLLGVHCDDLGRCVGRRVDWSFANEVVIPVDIAANTVVSLSPDGRRLLSAGAASWGVYDVEAATFAPGDPRVTPSGAVGWTPDGQRLMWVERGVVVTTSPDRDLVAFAVPRIDLDVARTVVERGDMRIVSLF